MEGQQNPVSTSVSPQPSQPPVQTATPPTPITIESPKISAPFSAVIVFILVGIGALLLAGMTGFYFGRQQNSSLLNFPEPSINLIQPTTAVACTADAKLCPDGSAVGRVPPTCEFKACPGETGSSPSSNLGR